MLHIACCLWEPNRNTHQFSLCYDATWVDRLYRSFRKHLTVPFRFVCFTDQERKFCEGIHQQRLTTVEPDYGCLIEPFVLNEPMMMCGLDTVVVGNIDHMAEYCLGGDKISLPRNPAETKKGQIINPIAFVPAGYRRVFDGWRGENDMIWLRTFESDDANKRWPGQILSLKLDNVRERGLRDARIVYMHGVPKAHQLTHLSWVKENWS